MPIFLVVCATTRHRNVSFAYYVTLDTASVRICKNAFVKLHQITFGKLDHIGKQHAQGQCAPKPNARGQYNTRQNRCPEVLIKLVREHISSFPSDESHYSRARNPVFSVEY